MKIDINTKMITLLGKPLGQSFAARMQNAGYEAAGLNMLYFYTEVDKDHLGDVVNGLRWTPCARRWAPATPWSRPPRAS